ncbi:MAG: DUF1569 domain-containing protein [Phycisphaerales bacterium]|nr:MAG: DUF1569 domain-containing protein [Phycisphaerales bacterium]
MTLANTTILKRMRRTDGPMRTEDSRISNLRDSLRSIPERAEKLADCGLIRGKNWSLAQICEHLALSIENTVRGSIADGVPRRWQCLSRVRRLIRWCLKNLILLTGYFPKGAPAPNSVQPPDGVPLDEALDRLRAATEAFDRKHAAGDASWGYHSLLGRMNGRAWRRFHRIHAAHHFSFMR